MQWSKFSIQKSWVNSWLSGCAILALSNEEENVLKGQKRRRLRMASRFLFFQKEDNDELCLKDSETHGLSFT